MKKVLFFCIAALASFSVSAEDVIQTKPVSATAGETGENYLSVQCYRDSYANLTQIQFNIVLPAGMTLNAEPWDYGEDLIKVSGRTNKIYSHSYDVSGGTDGNYLVIVSNNSNEQFNAGNGELVKLYYDIAPNMAAGIYPIIVKTVKITGDDDDQHLLSESTSYVKVGSPKDATLAVTGLVPSFVTSALNNETAITTLDLTAATAINGEFALMDSRSLILPEKDVTVEKGTYSRKVPTGYSTLCLPFSYTCGNKNIELFTFGGLKDGKTLVLTPPDDADGEVNANTPVIFKATNAGTLELATSRPFKLSASTSLTVEKGDGVSLIGTYAKLSAPKGSYVLQSQNDMEAFYKVGSIQPSVLANRCYLTSASGEVKAFAFPDCPTAIDGIEADANESVIYDIAGRRVSKADKGIYIVDGKKLVK